MRVVVPEALLEAGAAVRKLAEEPRTAREVDRVLSTATIRAVRGRIGPASAVPLDDVRKYYDDNRARYDTPERYLLWRILCKTRDDAALVLEQAKNDPSPKTFGELAREHSLDKATNLRDGNLGFLTPDGASSEPGLRVDPALVRAARSVRDGELVPAPVPEGEYFAVVWRRGTIATNRRTVDDVAAQIRDTLWKARVKEETERLLEALRASKLRDFDSSLVDTIAVATDTDAGVSPSTGARAPREASRWLKPREEGEVCAAASPRRDHGFGLCSSPIANSSFISPSALAAAARSASRLLLPSPRPIGRSPRRTSTTNVCSCAKPRMSTTR